MAYNYNQNQYNQSQYPPQNQQQYGNRQGNNWQSPNQRQQGNWQQPQQPQQQQYNTNYNQGGNNWQQPQQQQQYNNNNQGGNNWQQPQPMQQKQYAPVQTTQPDAWSFDDKQKKSKGTSKSKSDKFNCGLGAMCYRFGGLFGILAIMTGIAAILCMLIGMSMNELTYREYSNSVGAEYSTKCGYFDITMCNPPLMVGGTTFTTAGVDVDCVGDSGISKCCTFKLAQACDMDYVCGETKPDCVYCHNYKAGRIYFWCSLIGLIVICVSTLAICIGLTRKIAWIGFLIGIVAIVIGLVIYPVMLKTLPEEGAVYNEKGCGETGFCCYFSDCEANDENCPSPQGKTGGAMIVTIVLCVVSIVFIFISKKRS